MIKFNIVPSHPKWLPAIENFYSTVDKWIRTRGELNTIQRLKDLRVIVYSLSSDNPFKPVGYGLYKSGLPRIFGSEMNISYANGDQRVIRVILTLLQVSRSIKAYKKVDTSTITDTFKGDSNIFTEFEASMPELMNRLPLRSERQPWSKLHIATTMGPIGPSMLCGTELIAKFLDRFQHLSKDLGFEDLTTYISGFKDLAPHWWKLYPSRPEKVLRRLGIVPDVDGKSRVIGILDYWSQSILKPIHKDLMATLESLGGPRGPDLTYGQDIKPFGPENEPYYSIDLSAATDRFPVKITEIILGHIYDPLYAKAWRELMVGESFLFGPEVLKYSVGQPMGAYSS